jgi:tetratricopeptide (TPR) repeat protein
MDTFRRLIHEIHRRSLWQVVSIYLVGSWGALQVVDQVTESAGLPDWVPPVALLLLVVGLPIVGATAFVQEGMSGAGKVVPDAPAEPAPSLAPGTGSLDRPTTRPRGMRRVLTWRNAIGGGIAAALLLGVMVGGYFAMRVAGIGPVASLAAQGVIGAGEPVILSEFDNTSTDASLGGVVTEALRVDLASSSALALVPPNRIREVLERMQRDPSEPLTAQVAGEVAVRDGIKAVIEGEVGSAGSGYILVATLRSPDSGVALATFRRTAKGPDEVIDAIDGLSQDIREKAGESLRSIKAEAPLEAVTTASLDALRKYSEAEALADRGDYRRARTLLKEAVQADPGFAMAWRKLAVVLQSAGGEPGEEQEAATKAFELRDRLTERERLQTVAYYHNVVTGDLPAQIEAYEGILEEWPDDANALNNLSIAYGSRTRWEDGIALLRRAVSGPGESGPAWTNLVAGLAGIGDVVGARAALDSMEARYPKRETWNLFDRWMVALAAGDLAEAHQLGERMAQLPEAPSAWRSSGTGLMATADAAGGKLSEAREHLRAEVARSRVEGRFGDALNRGLDLVDLEAMVLPDPAPARSTLREVLASGDLEKVPPVARPFDRVVHTLGGLSMVDEARGVLAAWARDGGAAAGTALSEARTYVDAVASPDAGAALDALERLRTELGCPRCFQWQMAGLGMEAGRLDRAAELYEESVAVDGGTSAWFGLVRVMGQERLGQVYEALGDSVKAAEHYRSFAEAWAGADASFEPRVRVAREKGSAPEG